MFFFILLVLISVFAYIYSSAKDFNVIYLSRTCIFLLLFLPVAVQYGVGRDYFSYINIFTRISKGRNISIERGYYVINKLISYFNLDVQWVFAIVAFLTVFFLLLAIPRRSAYIIVICYYSLSFSLSLNVIRQALASVIAYYAFQIFAQKKYFRAFMILILAFLFHKSSILYFIVVLSMVFIKINKNHALVMFALIVFSNIYSETIVNFIYDKVLIHTPFSIYLSIDYLYVLTNRKTGYGIILRYIVFALILLFEPKRKDTPREVNNVLILFLFTIFFDFIGLKFAILSRISMGFYWGWFPMVHHIITNPAKYRKILLIIICSWLVMNVIATQTYDTNQYRTIFNKY